MPRPKTNGPYAKLSATYYLDDAILDAGPEAELLFARCLAFTAASSSDGFITERQMKTVGIGLRNVPRRVESLLRVGILESADGGYLIRSWLRWNKSAEEIGRDLRQDRQRKRRSKMHGHDSGVHAGDSEMHGRDSEPHAGYSEPHGGSDQTADVSSEYPRDYAAEAVHSARNPDGIPTDSSPQYKSKTSQGKAMTSQTPTVAPAVLANGFEAAWSHWPKKVERKQAVERFKVALKSIDITELVNAIIRFGDAYAATTERKFVPALGVWLNNERWTDELPQPDKRQTKTEQNLDFVAQLKREQQEAQWGGQMEIDA
jgi:hypothetical protein